MKKEEMFEAIVEAAQEVCMEALKEKDRDLNLTGKCKKCYDYLAEQFILDYIDDRSMFDVVDDIRSGKFYNTWKGSLYRIKYVVEAGRKFPGIENIINSSGISRKTWVKFFDSLTKR